MRNLSLILVFFAASGSVWAVQNAPSVRLVPFQQDKKWGYTDSKGQEVIPPMFDKAEDFHDGLAAVATWVAQAGGLKRLGAVLWRVQPHSELRWGFIDERGTSVIAPQFTEVKWFSDGLAAVTREPPFSDCGCWGYIDRSGRTAIKPRFDRAEPFSEGLAFVQGGGIHLYDPVVKAYVSMGYIDKTGRWVIKSKFWRFYFSSFSEGLAPFRRNLGKWGYINLSGRVAIKPRYDWAGDFSGGLAPVLAHGTCSFIDKSGKVTMKEMAQQTESPKEAKIKEWERSRGTLEFEPNIPPCP
jgi:WG containing repeat